MRRRLGGMIFSKLVCLLLLFVLTAPLMAQEIEQPAEVEPTILTRGLSITTQQGEPVLLYKESHALVIGVSNYTQGWPKLPGVRRDVQEVKTALEAHGFNVVVHTDLDKNALEQAFDDFINTYGREPENRLSPRERWSVSKLKRERLGTVCCWAILRRTP